MRIKKLLFIIPTIAFFAVLIFMGFVPHTANALTAPSLSLVSFERQYGDFVLDSKWTYSPQDDVFISYGDIIDGKYEPLSKEDNGAYQYECRLNLLVVDEENGDIFSATGQTKLSRPYDGEGNCTLNPSPTGNNGGGTYRLHQGYFKKGTKEEPFAKLFATEKGKAEGLTDFNLTSYSSEASIIVKRRKINIGVQTDAIPDGVGYTENERIEGEKTVKELNLNRTFSLETRLVLSDDSSGLVFNHKISDFVALEKANNGMYLYDNVGQYAPFTLGNDNVIITDDEGRDVTNHYEISSDYNIQVNVEKLQIVAPIYSFESVYLQNCIDIADVSFDEDGRAIIHKSSYDLINFINASTSAAFKNSEDKVHYLDHNGNLATNSSLSVHYSYSIRTSLEAFYPALSDDVSEYSLYVNMNPASAYECIPVLLSVDGYDKTEGFDNNENFELICDENSLSSFKINKRTIILYGEGADEQDPMLTPDPSSGIHCVLVSSQDFAKPYGFAYSESSFSELSFPSVSGGAIDTYLTVTFKIENFDEYLNDPKFHSIGDKVILNVGEYAIVPENITDWRYDATIHKSLHYTVTPKELTLSELFESQSFVNETELIDGKYVISSYNYECDPTVYETVALKFSQRLPYPQENGNGEFIENDPVFEINFNFAKQTAPGVYSSIGLCLDESSNFILTDLEIDEESGEVQNIAIRIYNKLLTVTVSDIEYDGTTPEIVIEGKADEFDYEISKSYCSGNKYDTKSVIKGEPVNAGTYTVRLQLKESNVYSFEGGHDYIDVTFKITKRKIVVTVVAKGDKTFGTEGYFKSPTDSNIATYTVAYNGEDKSKPALINGDKLGNLTSKAADKTAKPQTYEISTANIKNDNYEITFLNSEGYGKAESIKVVKLTKEIPELTSFAKGNACVIKVSGEKITLAIPTLFGVSMTYELTYSVDGGEFITDNVKKNKDNVEISGLSEGTKYTIRYTISKNSDYLALSKNCIVEIIVTTSLTAPEVEQNIDKTTDTQIFVNLYNYQNDEDNSNGTYFAYIEDNDMFVDSFRFDIPAEFISFVEECDEYGDVINTYAVLDIAKAIAAAQGDDIEFYLQPDCEYVLYVLREKDFALEKSDQEPLTVYTAPQKLDIKKSDIGIIENTIFLNIEPLDEDDIYVIEYILGDSKTTITSILDDDVDLSPVFQKEGVEINFGDGLVINGTLADRIYYLKIYKEKRFDANGTEKVIKGEPIYFEIHTPKADTNAVTTALLKISGYIGVGTMVVLLVALIIFSVLYSKLRRKWRIE